MLELDYRVRNIRTGRAAMMPDITVGIRNSARGVERCGYMVKNACSLIVLSTMSFIIIISSPAVKEDLMISITAFCCVLTITPWLMREF